MSRVRGRSRDPMSVAPTGRVAVGAESTGLGSWRRSEYAAPGSDNPEMWFVWAVALPLIGAQVAALVGFAGFSISDPDSGPGVGAWCLIILAVLIALGSLLACGLLLRVAIGIRRAGRLVMHLYERGLVLERSTGRVMAALYAQTGAEHIVFANRGEDRMTWDDHMVLLSFADGSRARVFHSRQPGIAREVAAACGARPRRRVDVDEAVELGDAYDWQ